MSATDRITALEQQLAEAQREIAALKGQLPPIPQPPAPPLPIEVPGPRVLTVYSERTTDQPTLAELKRLFAIVRPLVPAKFDDRFDADKPQRGFNAAFRWVSNQGRSGAPNGKFGLGYWLDACRSWLRERNCMTVDIDGACLVAAVLASGDISYVPHNGNLGHVWEFSLVTYGGKPASPDGWRRVLSTGNVLSASQPARLAQPPSPVRIYG